MDLSTPIGFNPLHLSPFLDERKKVEEMLENSTVAQVNVEDHNGNTPLIWAVAQGQDGLVQLLVDQGANVNSQNFNGETALFLAAAYGFHRICTILLENGAVSSLCNLDGATPVHIAAANGHDQVLACLRDHGAFLNVQDEEGETCLFYAIRGGHQKTMEFLVKECNINVEIRNEDEESAVELASCLAENWMVQFLSNYSRGNTMETMERTGHGGNFAHCGIPVQGNFA